MPKFIKKNMTGSGNLSLSARIKIREYDNRTGHYSTTHRAGDKNRKGNLALKPFDDGNTLIFGKLIEDNFSESGHDNTTNIDSKKWTFSKGLKIRKEKKKNHNNNSFSLVFEGTDSSRFLQTREKIRNPNIELHLQQGPLNNVKGGLNLVKGNRTSGLKLQISVDGIAYTLIKTFDITSDLKTFYDPDEIKKDIYRKIIKIGPKDIPDPGEPYYIRILQTNLTNSVKGNWAIPFFKIEINDQQITYGINNQIETVEGLNVLNKYVSNPIFVSTSSFQLSGKGAIVKGVSDSMSFSTKKEEPIRPFKDVDLIDIKREFFNQGLDSNVYPGFEQPTKDKTVFEIDLSPAKETEFGYTDNYNNTSTSNSTNQLDIKLMTYWNNDLKRWEVIGDQGFRPGHPPSSPIDDTIDSFVLSNSAAPIGFGPMPNSVLKAAKPNSSNSSWAGLALNSEGLKDVVFHPEDYYSAVCRPIDNFGFPFADQYHATSSQYILAKDIGITKPFLLERCSLDFDARFQFGSKSTYALRGLFIRNTSSTQHSHVELRHRLIMPTFFMLRQGNHPVDKEFTRVSVEGRAKKTASLTRQITSGSRDLITYGQFTLINSASNSNETTTFGLVAEKDYIHKLLDFGLKRDGHHIHEYESTSTVTHPTGTFNIEFDCKTSPKYTDALGTSVFLQGGLGFNSLLTGDTTPGRSQDIESGNRALVNGYGASDPGEIVNIRPSNGTINLDQIIPPKASTIEKPSPYVIFPDDRLVFGWQYPLPSDNLSDAPHSTFKRYSTMVLAGISKLKLFGSLVSNGKEFHETLNQNLSSPSLYEHVLGNEKIIDQWQVEKKSQHSGSFLDNHFRNNTTSRIARIGQTAVSSGAGQAHSTGSFLRFIKNTDNTRTFIDSQKPLGTFFNNSSFGTMNTTGFNSSPSSTTVVAGEVVYEFEKNTKGKTIKPGYYFNYKHFGHSIDLIKQSHDSKYAEVIKKINKNEKVSAEGPIRIIFVEGEAVDNPDTKIFKEKSVDELINNSLFQSSNISLFSTASKPFIDDNTPKNRTYQEGSFIVV